jgi:fumarylacetoacetase
MTSWLPVPDGSPYPLHSLPFGVGSFGDGGRRAWVAVGDRALDLTQVGADGWLQGTGVDAETFAGGTLNRYVALGRSVAAAVRERLLEIVHDSSAGARLEGAVVPQTALRMDLPVAVGDYVDFYSSIHHATNLGRLLRPDDDPLLPNWRQLPVGYHGRSGTVVADGSDIPRPAGLRLVDGALDFGPSVELDIELEVGFVVGQASERGVPVGVADAEQHLAGVCLVNDWSARDIQSYEYRPLGPFVGKSFATSMSPWLVDLDALAPFRVVPPPQEPQVTPYLRTAGPAGFDLHLEVSIESELMRASGMPPHVIARTGFADMYWVPAQHLAHLTVNGANVRPGDLFASGTVSGPVPGSEGSLIELTRRGRRPIELPDGTLRSFLRDGDRVVMRGWAGSDPATRIGLGQVSGTVVANETR